MSSPTPRRIEPAAILACVGLALVGWVGLLVPSLIRQIEPAFVQNERTAVRTDGGRYLARCVYGFPVKEIEPKSRVVLVVRDSDGRDVSRFTIDLASMR